jgi:hypothetical protein
MAATIHMLRMITTSLTLHPWCNGRRRLITVVAALLIAVVITIRVAFNEVVQLRECTEEECYKGPKDHKEDPCSRDICTFYDWFTTPHRWVIFWIFCMGGGCDVIKLFDFLKARASFLLPLSTVSGGSCSQRCVSFDSVQVELLGEETRRVFAIQCIAWTSKHLEGKPKPSYHPREKSTDSRRGKPWTLKRATIN